YFADGERPRRSSRGRHGRRRTGFRRARTARCRPVRRARTAHRARSALPAPPSRRPGPPRAAIARRRLARSRSSPLRESITALVGRTEFACVQPWPCLAEDVRGPLRRTAMGKAIGLLLAVVSIWITVELYTQGASRAFGGRFAAMMGSADAGQEPRGTT